MANLEATERGKRSFEECVRAWYPNAVFEWQPISTLADGPRESLHVSWTTDGHLTLFPAVSFELLKRTDAEIKKEVEEIMTQLRGKT